MKQFALLFLILLGLIGCSDGDSVGEPDLTKEDFLKSYDVSVLIEYDSEDGLYGLAFAKGQIVSGSLYVDNVPVSFEGWSYSSAEGISSSWFNLGSAIDVKIGHSFSLSISGKTTSGFIQFPDSLEFTWPEVAYTNEDFALNWNVTNHPITYILGVEAEDADYNDIDVERQLDGSETSATIRHSVFQNYPQYFEVYLYPLNYQIKNGCFILTETATYYYDQDYLNESGAGKQRARSLLSKVRKQKTIVPKAHVR